MPPWVPVGDRVMSAGAPIQTVILYNHRYIKYIKYIKPCLLADENREI